MNTIRSADAAILKPEEHTPPSPNVSAAMMTAAAVTAVLRETTEMLNGRYRAAVRLDDGTFLPCVTFVDAAQWRSAIAGLATSTRQESSDGDASSFVAPRASTLSSDRIAEIHPSPFAWPAALIHALGDPVEQREYSHFALLMNDGHCVHYDVADPADYEGVPAYLPPPAGYTFDDVRSLIHRPDPPAGANIIRYGYDYDVLCPIEGL
jgi:hypothetical protein